MNMEYKGKRHAKSDERRRAERMRFVGSAVGLWAVCAAGIYLIGPGDEQRVSMASPAHSGAMMRASASVAAYQP